MTAVEFEPKPHHECCPYELSIIRGVPQNPCFDEESISNFILSFEPRPDDVFICTYPKSGTTWTQQIVNLLRCDGKDPPHSYAHAVPWLESLALEDPSVGIQEAEGWSLESLQTTPGPRVFKTHANLQDLPGRSRFGGTRAIYVARNPKDVAVSMYYHARNKKHFNFNGSFSDMFDHFYGGSCECGSWFTHVLDWWQAHLKDPNNVLFLKYEDMMRAPKLHIDKIAKFLGVEEVEDNILDTCVQKSDITTMRNDSRTASVVGCDHIRKGGLGGWRKYFTVQQSEAFDLLYRNKMKGSGLTFDFGSGLVM